jgi:hypothetical protein
MPKSLTFNTGIVEYDINGKVVVSFNPADETFSKKLFDAFDALNKLQNDFASGGSFDKFIELDSEMRSIIDDLLGEGVSDALFGGMNAYALADGLPVWSNLLMAIFYEVADAYALEFGKTSEQIKAHKKKYGALLAKYREGK